MVTGKRKYRVLVAGANDKLGESIAALLPKNEYEPPVFAANSPPCAGIHHGSGGAEHAFER